MSLPAHHPPTTSPWMDNARGRLRPRMLAAIAAAAVLTGAGCSGSGEPGSGPVTIRIQHQLNDAESAKFTELVGRFEAEHADIKIEQIRDNDEKYYDKLLTQVVGGSGPDIARLDPTHAAQYVNAGYTVALDSYLGSGAADAYFPNTLEPVRKGGELHGVPADLATLVLFYRTDLFEQAKIGGPPRTWDELIANARTLTTGGRHGIGLFGGWGAFEFYPWLWQAGGEVLDTSGGTPKVAFNSEQGVAALQLWVDLATVHKVMPQGVATAVEDDVKGPFVAGQLAMFTSGPWAVPSLKKAGIDGKWAVAPLPRGRESASVLGGLDWVVLKNSTHQQQAGTFLSWLMADPVQREWASSLGYIPVKRSLYDDPEFKNDELVSKFADALAQSRARPTIAQATAVDDALGKAVQAALSGAAPAKQALDDAAREAQKAIDG